jgi:hypothetical protein
MELTKEQERAVQHGQPVHLRKGGLDCVIIRADLYDRVATLIENDNLLMPTRTSGSDQPGSAGERGRETTELPCDPWTEEENERRCELIDKDIEGTVTEPEKSELERLQERFHKYMDAIAPLPMDGARRIHRQLLAKKRQRERGGAEH